MGVNKDRFMNEKLKDIEMISCEFSGAPLQVYLIKDEKIVLIDTGVADTPQKFIFPYLQEKGWTAKDVSMAINTHGHHDHFGGNGQFYHANPHVEIVVHRNDLAWVEDHQRHFNEMYRSFPGEWEPDEMYEQAVLDLCGEHVPVSRILEDEDELSLGKTTVLHSISIPSHTNGHVMLYLETLKTAFSGDAIQWKGTVLNSGTVVFPLYDRVETYLNTLQQFNNMKLEHICTGHFGIISGEQIDDVLKESMSFVSQHSEFILQALRQSSQPLSLHELALTLHSKHYSQYDFAYQIHATTYTHCQYLREQGWLERVPVENKLKWQAKR